MSHPTRHTPSRSTARAVAAPCASVAPAARNAALATLILSISVLLLSGAAWMQLT